MKEKQSADYYKCKSDEYALCEKGKVYPESVIRQSLQLYPEDWQPVLNYPKAIEIIDCIENGTNKMQIIKALKQWKKTK